MGKKKKKTQGPVPPTPPRQKFPEIVLERGGPAKVLWVPTTLKRGASIRKESRKKRKAGVCAGANMHSENHKKKGRRILVGKA